MIRRVLECETCKAQVDIPEFDYAHPYARIPETWFTLVEGNPQANAAWHFCSEQCLHGWLLQRFASATGGDK